MSDPTRTLLVGSARWLDDLAEAMASQSRLSVRAVETRPAALEAFRDGRVDCIVTQYDLGESTGLALLRDVREESTSVPVVLAAAAGSETVASDAIAAGVDDYVAVDEGGDEAGDEAVQTLLERTERAVHSAQRAANRRERARQFDAIFDDERTATWVLDPDGRLVRVNQAASDAIDADASAVVGDPFWTLPWWSHGTGVQRDVRRIVETAIDGAFGSAVVDHAAGADGRRVIDLSARPVENERGELVSVVVEGVDITERVALERDLRESEELHRVTLNNMTDTVLITDGDGEYTYVCPNVHFIFGYTAAEIRDRGTITDLLGEDLFDREELAERGVLKNIECTVTDKAGREHTLLVNVREVSIQGGTLLYSCRDITKRKQREEALATLQETARDFLYAETDREIARHVVDDTPGVLDVDASAVYLYDADENALQPTAYSPGMEARNGPLPTVHADGDTLPGYSFVEDESLFFDDVHDADRLANPASDLRSGAYVPLGEHGVFVVGTDRVAAFDEVSRELVDLLAATAEAALDRVSRESRLREQDRTLQRQNDRLTALNRINETIREIDQALVQAETSEEIDQAVCERLTADGRFAFAWIGATDPTAETLEPRAWAGAERGYLDSASFVLDGPGAEPAVRTATTGDVTMVTDVAARLREEEWRTAAIRRDFSSVLSIPLAYNDLTHGVLTVYAEARDAFDETSRSVLAELGETVASALSSLERKHALLTTSMTRVAFEIDDPTFLLSRLAREAECSLTYEGGVRQTTAGSDVFVTVEGSSLDAVAAVAADLVAVDDVHRISADGEGGVLRLGLSQPFLALDLADHGAVFRRATADPDSTTLVVDVPEGEGVRRVGQLVEEAFADVDLRSKRTVDRTPDRDLRAAFLEGLTDRQLEVMQTAYYSGFFESPRENTGEDVAAMLDISPAAFYQHARAAQRKLFATVFEGDAPAADPGEGRLNN